MPTHKITLTDKGFKTLSTEFIMDCLAGIILLGIVFTYTIQETNNLMLFGFFLLITSGIYIFYRTKNGYIYPVGFFYQILLFWALTPPLFINWYSVSFVGVIMFGLYYKKNPFQTTYFPMSVCLALLITSSVFLFGKIYIYKELMDVSTNTSYFFLDNVYISGYFFKLFSSPNGSFSANSYSIFEKLGYYSPLLMATLSFRQKNVLIDFVLILGMFGLSLLYFENNLEYLIERPFVLVTAWYLIFAAPGRNKGFSLYFSILSLILTGMFTLTFIKESSSFPPFMVIISFFLFQSIIYIITQNISFIIKLKRSIFK
jgi:hypothetical protein